MIKIYTFDVGHGDNLLLKFNNNDYGLVDFCWYYNETDFLPSFEFLKDQFTDSDTISFCCITHYDKDHYCGANMFLNWLKTKEKLMPKIYLPATINVQMAAESSNLHRNLYPSNSTAREKLFLALNRFCRKGQVEYVKELDEKNIQENITLKVLSPTSKSISEFEVNKDVGNNINHNETSITFKIEYNSLRLLFGGDLLKKNWIEIIEKKEHIDTLDSDFFKVSHHGAKNATDKRIWQSVLKDDGSTHVVYSCGRDYPKTEPLHDSSIKKHKVYTTNQLFITSDLENKQYGWDFDLKCYQQNLTILNTTIMPQLFQSMVNDGIDENFIGFEFECFDDKIQSYKMLKKT